MLQIYETSLSSLLLLLLLPLLQIRAARGSTSAAAIAANVAAEGYDSDEEVYATAKALQVCRWTAFALLIYACCYVVDYACEV